MNAPRKAAMALPAALLAAAVLLTGCGKSAAVDVTIPTENEMKNITANLMPAETNIHQMLNGGLACDYEDIIGKITYLDMEMEYARVTDSIYSDWETLTGYFKSILTENYMTNNYMNSYLLSAEEAKSSGEPLMYLEFDSALGRNTASDGAGIVEYMPESAAFSEVTENSFTATMQSVDGYGSTASSTVHFIKGEDGSWRIDSIENQWSEPTGPTETPNEDTAS